MRRVLLALCLAGAAFGQAITYPSSPSSNPNQITVTTAWLYSNKMQYKGAWSSSTTYGTQDLVTYSNASYVSATTGNLNNTPSGVSLFWAQLPGGGGGGAVSSVFGRTGTVTATSGDYTAAQVTNAADTSGSYSNPAWITALAWSKITGTPTFYYQNVQANGSAQTQRSTINLINGTNITVSCSDVSSITTCSFSLSGTFNAATATALAATPAQCTSGQYSTGITAAGVANCAQVAYSQLSGTPSLPANTTSTTHQFFNAYDSSTGAFTKAQPACADLSNAAASCSTDTTNATNIGSGTLGSARGGAGSISGALKGNGSGVVSQAACGDLSNAAASCSTDTTVATNITSGTLPAAQVPANIRARGIGYVFDGAGSVLTTRTAYLTVPFACTISAWNMTVGASGTATVDIWKIATGTAIPTVANTITASAIPAISTGTAKHSTTLTAWTTSVAANDILGFNLSAVATATNVSLVLECDQ